jgi:peptidoglycan/xylan/chitin deacetylase (PgdA/CDA1 family)
VWRGDESDHRVALTFDAGSDCGNVTTILDILADSGITASFGLTGRWVELCPTEAERIGQAGHQLLNHSYDHPSFTGRSTGEGRLSSDQIVDQVRRAEAAIVAATGRGSLPWFRAPYGDRDEAVHEALGRAGAGYDVLWTVDSRGWQGIPAEEVLRIVRDGAGNGAIILMHVGTASTDHLALRAIIEHLRAEGFGFTTVADLV